MQQVIQYPQHRPVVNRTGGAVMITALCVTIANIVFGICIYIKIVDKHRIERMAREFKARGEQS